MNLDRALAIEGWMTREEMSWLAEQAARCAKIVEIGSWQGRSTRAMADNTGATIYAVDTWQGSIELQEELSDKPEGWLLEQFQKNTEGCANIVPLPMASLEAAVLCKDWGQKFDMVFIDGSHQYQDVKRDILAWLPLVAEGGVLCGHDYSDTYHAGVRQAVDELLPGRYFAPGSIWYIIKPPANTVSFSVVSLAKNEAASLPRLAASLREFLACGGEWLILDTGSADGTPAIARSLGARVEEVGEQFVVTVGNKAEAINQQFIAQGDEPIVSPETRYFDFGSARNYAASLASNDFVDMPDCDEFYAALDLDRVAQSLRGGADSFYSCYVFSRDEYGNEAVKFNRERFYDRRKARWVGTVHECLSVNGRSGLFAEDEMRIEQGQNVNQRPRLQEDFAGLGMDFLNWPQNDRNAHYMARSLMYGRRYRSAIREFLRHIEMNKWPTERAQSMIYVGDCFGYLGEGERSLDWYHRAFSADGTRREALMRLAWYWRNRGDYQRTAAYASAALTIPYSPLYMNNMAHYREEPHDLLYWAFYYLGRKEESRMHWQQALAFQPSNARYQHDAKFYEESQ